MKVFLDSIGCRLNQSEMETLARRLLAAGHEVVSEAQQADKVVVNTCAVTSEASRDGRNKVRRFHRANPAAEIVLTGCHATLAPDELEALDGVGRIVPNASKEKLAELLDPAPSPPESAAGDAPQPYLADRGNTRAFVKAQDGCDNQCTFCVTTVARGEGRSRHLGDVVDEIRRLVEAGYNETVLTGVHLGSYGHDLGNKHGLRDLVAAILERTTIPRLRLSSLEPWDLTPAFFDLWTNSRLMPHLHLPLQAGCDRVLRRMARRTSCAEFRALATAARERIDGLSLSTDIICGFPGETDTDFEEGLEFVREIGFSRLHVFTYSPRPGTAAAGMDGQVAPAVRKQRTRRMIRAGRELGLAFHRRFEDRKATVLWETATTNDRGGERSWSGYTEHYIRVSARSAAPLGNTLGRVRLARAREDGMDAVCVA